MNTFLELNENLIDKLWECFPTTSARSITCEGHGWSKLMRYTFCHHENDLKGKGCSREC